ncbi:mannose-6-phosphate isomerase [Desulfonema ishimotonii]|uniref:Mannose-6-phosphate isomerase n=1 Tax=Desulfonema ishimotonii TaxID=45657 RepID=A0A401FRD4_9BACT|nr:cupin domain-containing protein [Desulfonema ishimotonii]GBC59526.1 mannose-6-phosphate isomerase [Desulfonema ishimotonii]
MEKISISDKLRTFDKYWQSKLVGEFNSQSVKLAKMKGEFDWHHHKTEDELFLILKGQLKVDFKNEYVTLNEGELFIVPRNRGHRLVAEQEVQLLVVEPKSTLNIERPQEENHADDDS